MMRTLSIRVRYTGLLGVVAGAVFIVYGLSKGPLTALIALEGWRIGGLSPDQLALLVHVAEGFLLMAIAVAFVGLSARLKAKFPADVGMAVALAGFGLTVVVHLAEHLLAPMTVPALFGDENLYIWGYYLSWLVLYTGFAIFGLGILRSDAVPAWLGGLFVVSLPVVLLVGMAVVALDLFTLAGTFRLALGGTWVLVGSWLWWSSTRSARAHGKTGASGVDAERQ